MEYLDPEDDEELKKVDSAIIEFLPDEVTEKVLVCPENEEVMGVKIKICHALSNDNP